MDRRVARVPGAMRPASPSRVAEKHIVCRSRGSAVTMRSIAGRKPMSSIRSASSRTSILMLSNVNAPRARRSSSRPGVATSSCDAAAALACLTTPTPPYTAVIRSARACAIPRMSSTIWLASSRVGASTSAAGRASSAPIRSTIGIPNASVLPEPVGDFAITSRPWIASAITARWIANGSAIPAAERERMTACETPRSAKDSVDMHNSLAAHAGRERFGRRWLTRTVKCGTQASCLAADVAGRYHQPSRPSRGDLARMRALAAR